MRTGKIDISLTLRFPCDRPDLNGVCYTQEAIEKAISSLDGSLPIVVPSNNCYSNKTVGYTTSRPYAVQFDNESQTIQLTIDGTVMNGGTQCFVNERDANGNISDFTISAIGISQVN